VDVAKGSATEAAFVERLELASSDEQPPYGIESTASANEPLALAWDSPAFVGG
jgi:hypothetical protein